MSASVDLTCERRDMENYEKLGAFYLGRPYDLKHQKPKEGLLLYDSKDLVTHAVCVGMTGSGKTGLCLSLLEEAAIDNIPALVIDPKGDLANLLLTFPDLRGSDFEPWVNSGDAQRKALSVPDYAQEQAALWKKGLAEWGQSGERIARFKAAADIAIYTPGSSAGLPVAVLKSFAAPDKAVLEDRELLRDRLSTTATSLLGLLGIVADPIQSREHILLSTLLSQAWQQRRDLDLAGLIAQIQSPPVGRIGVMDLESFYPAKDRFGLAMQVNNLLASPGFESWMEGDPLDVNAFLYTPEGKPRISIFSIAHLSDSERMFFVSLLLNQVLGWVRSQSGTTSLRALLYMDEIFGYFPPVANPPSKAPLLTLLKQARAFGVGVVLATQNPVDLDYKGLANAGTWFIGRLQTERDKARVLEGLEGAAASASATFDRQVMEQTLAGLGNRVFLMNNVHDDGPEVFETRWALSYLRGPLTRDQIKMLMQPRKTLRASQSEAAPSVSVPARTLSSKPASGASSQRPVLPPEITQFFIPLRSSGAGDSVLHYEPMLLGFARVYFSDSKTKVDAVRAICRLAGFTDDPLAVNWQDAQAIHFDESDLEKEPASAANFAPSPAAAGKARSYDAWKRSLSDDLYRTQVLELYRSPSLGQFSQVDELERDFRIRLQQMAREERDHRVEALRKKYASRFTVLQDRIRRAQQAVERETQQAQHAKMQAAVSFGATLLGALLGRKTVSATTLGRATTAVRGVGRSMKESQDITRAGETVEALQQQFADLEGQLQAETAALEAKIDPATEKLESITLRPKKTNISVTLLTLAWAPFWREPGGVKTAAWQ